MGRRKAVVAVVDDDPSVIGSLENLLESSGYGFVGFASARHLLNHGVSDLDLVITDIGMPGMDGLELREVVKRTRPDLPVFLITGRHEIADRERAPRLGAVFRKPFDVVALLDAIAKALEQQELEGEHEE
ncbi:response regulator [Kaistia dalseonensis]|uniref:FixJ family two-component response regulator n=1 Tax=Kaistia dalseonensis TaxID=410840 RepID=A0ABU0H0Y0_9HYPH|nr:response regulator [Kaistia dalseonensis]MCX5493407.1 response regulator [Kaistia dalseonensis]MDQ0435965.1 FixJ family two-component response regulator [Kaistia dalseonensis]